ncbi:MAG: GNAT family N-acetyltransferase [Planctomyces sp.]|nr:GNAT family N-acetyltransferase [Planctomyces sp.]
MTVQWATQLQGDLRFAIVESLADWLHGQSAVSFPGALLFDRSRLLVAAGFSTDSASVVSATTPIVAPDHEPASIPSHVLQLYSGLAYYARSQGWPAIRCLISFPVDDETRFQFSECPWEEAAIIQHWCRECSIVAESGSTLSLRDGSQIEILETDAGLIQHQTEDLRLILESSDDLPDALRPRADDLIGNWIRLDGVRYFIARKKSKYPNSGCIGLVVICGRNIEYLGVSPGYRRQGVGAALVNESIRMIERHSCRDSALRGGSQGNSEVTAYSDASNVAANRLYDRLDFHVKSKWLLLVWPEKKPAG